MKKIAMLLMAAALCRGTSFALDPDVQITPHGFVYFQLGQYEQTWNNGGSGNAPDKTWDERFDVRLGCAAVVDQRMQVIVGAELPFLIRQGTSTFGSQVTGGDAPTLGSTTGGANQIKEAQGIYTFGDDPRSKTPPLQIALGYFPFKYDASATNLGEYLFSSRAGVYPQYIITDFDNCQARLLGLRATSWPIKQVRLDMLLNSEQYTTVGGVGDLTLSFLAGYKLGSLLDCGAGVSFYRLIPVYAPFENQNPPYTVQGTKLMARCSFDPKPLISKEFSGLLGPQDLKIYGEAAILGVKNYSDVSGGTFYYDTVGQRIPIMLGFDLPTFKVLDVLSLEGEYFDSPYQDGILGPGVPYPLSAGLYPNQQKYHWSIWAQKTLTKGFAITGLIGKDHFRWVNQDGSTTLDDLLEANGNWHYNVRAMFTF